MPNLAALRGMPPRPVGPPIRPYPLPPTFGGQPPISPPMGGPPMTGPYPVNLGPQPVGLPVTSPMMAGGNMDNFAQLRQLLGL